jgi:hypothetical protein
MQKIHRRYTERGTRREETEDRKTEGRALPEVPNIHPLTTALRERGVEAADRVPGLHPSQ